MKTVTFPDVSTTKLTEPMLEHEVCQRAFELYEERGKADGHALEDWVLAEAQIRQRHLHRT